MEAVLSLHEDFWKVCVFNERIPGNKSDGDLPHFTAPWAACLLYDWCLRKRKAGGCPWVHSHCLLTRDWGELRPEGMNALGLYSGHTFWKPNILDSQGWFRPTISAFQLKLIPAMNTWKGIHSVFPQACIHPCLDNQVGLAPPRFPAAQILL